MNSHSYMPRHRYPYPAVHQIRGGASVSDDIIATFKEELRKMREDLKREAEMEFEATRKELQKKLGKKVVPRSDPIDLGVTEDDVLDDDDYDYIEEEVEVEVDVEEEEEDHDNEEGDSAEPSHNIVKEKEEDEEQTNDDDSGPANTFDEYTRIDKAYDDSQRTDQGDNGLEDNFENDEEECEPNMDESQADVGESVYAETVDSLDDHDHLSLENNQDKLKSITHLNQEDDGIRAKNVMSGEAETLEIGESEEIDGNVSMSNNKHELSSLENTLKENGTKSRKHTKNSRNDRKNSKNNKNNKKKKSSKKEKRKDTLPKNIDSEKAPTSQIDSLAHDISLKSLPPQPVSFMRTFVKALVPTIITLLLIVLSHFLLEAIVKQFSPRQ